MPKGLPISGVNKGWFQKGFKPWNHGLRYSHKIQRECKYCGKIFYVNKSRRGKFCSQYCSGKVTGFQTGEASWNKGLKGFYTRKPRPPEVKEKIRQARLGVKRPEISNENHYNWKGGISREPYCEIWLDKEYKNDLMERDENRCMNPDCWQTTEHLPLGLHHINYVKKDCSPDNLITLCRSCNTQASYNREYWQPFYESIMTIKTENRA